MNSYQKLKARYENLGVAFNQMNAAMNEAADLLENSWEGDGGEAVAKALGLAP